MTDVGRVALAARVFTVAALTSLAAVAGQRYLDGALFIILTASVAQSVAVTRRVSETTVAIIEGGVVAVIAVLMFPDQATVAPYLVIPVLIGAVDRGRTGLLRVIATEAGVLLVAWVASRATMGPASSRQARSRGCPPRSASASWALRCGAR